MGFLPFTSNFNKYIWALPIKFQFIYLGFAHQISFHIFGLCPANFISYIWALPIKFHFIYLGFAHQISFHIFGLYPANFNIYIWALPSKFHRLCLNRKTLFQDIYCWNDPVQMSGTMSKSKNFVSTYLLLKWSCTNIRNYV